MPLSKPVRCTVLPGDGPCPQVLRQVLGIASKPSGDAKRRHHAGYALLLCLRCQSSLAGRAALFAEGIRFAVTHLLPCQKTSLAQILRILAAEPCGDDEVFRLVHWESYLKLTHDLKYLFCYRSTMSFWFAFNPIEDENARVERYRRRLNKLQTYIEEMESLVGSQYEADCVGRILRPFVDALDEWFGSRDLTCHPSELGAQFFHQFNARETLDYFQRFQEYISKADENPSKFNRETLRIYSVIQSAIEKSL